MVPPGASLDETIDQPEHAFEPKRVSDERRKVAVR